jgi:hypothetical protein
MDWICPACHNQNKGASTECSCGYSFYKILGITPGTPLAETKKTYNYLQKVWGKDKVSRDTVAQKKAQERMGKIDEAFALYMQVVSPSEGVAEKAGAPKIIPFAAVGILLVVIIVVAVFVFTGERKDEQTASLPGQKADIQPQSDEDVTGRLTPPASEFAATETAPQEIGEAPDAFESSDTFPMYDMTEEKAIEVVKKSRVLNRLVPTDTFMKRWADKNAGTMAIIGWQAKKMDDENYLVSYTARDGEDIKGFYFVLDPLTGSVQNLANNFELQQKYNISYN